MQGLSIAIFPIYVPPKGMAANTLRQVTKRILRWISDEIDKLGHACVPIVAGDWNCGFGYQVDQTGKRFVQHDSEEIGTAELTHESQVSRLVRDFLEENHLSMFD
eukprot:7565808-Pyramimonas_sp.AAC.1